jgi:hypothetical protein
VVLQAPARPDVVVVNLLPVRHLRNTAWHKYATGRAGRGSRFLLVVAASRATSRSTLGVMPQPRTRPEGVAMFLLISEGSCCILPLVTERS